MQARDHLEETIDGLPNDSEKRETKEESRISGFMARFKEMSIVERVGRFNAARWSQELEPELRRQT